MTQNIHPKSKTKSEDEKRTFYLLFMGHSTPMYVYDLQTLKILEVNNAALEKYRYSRDEFLSLTVRDMIQTGEDVPFSATAQMQERGENRRGIHNPHHRFQRAQSRTGNDKGYYRNQISGKQNRLGC